MAKTRFPRKCVECTDNRPRDVAYFYPYVREEDQYDDPWLGALLCRKHWPDDPDRPFPNQPKIPAREN